MQNFEKTANLKLVYCYRSFLHLTQKLSEILIGQRRIHQSTNVSSLPACEESMLDMNTYTSISIIQVCSKTILEKRSNYHSTLKQSNCYPNRRHQSFHRKSIFEDI